MLATQRGTHLRKRLALPLLLLLHALRVNQVRRLQQPPVCR
jgi:hypothetical protein